MKGVELISWSAGMDAISAVNALREHCDLSLFDAKRIVGVFLDGRNIIVYCSTDELAARLVDKLKVLRIESRTMV